MWIHFDDIPIGIEFEGFFGKPIYRKVTAHNTEQLGTAVYTLHYRDRMLRGFTEGYYFFPVRKESTHVQ